MHVERWVLAHFLLAALFPGVAIAQNAVSNGDSASSPTDQWIVRGRTESFPAGTASIEIVISSGKNQATGSFVVLWDDVFVGPAGTVPVTLQSFSAD